MQGRPRRPARASGRAGRRQDHGEVKDGVRGLQQQLAVSPAFLSMAEQPEKLLEVLRCDPHLQEAAGRNPDLARLLDASTLRGALAALRQQPGGAAPGDGAAPAPAALSTPGAVQALMSLQNYALQLRRAKEAAYAAPAPPADDTALPRDAHPEPPPRQAHAAAAAAEAEAAAVHDRMWALLQLRLDKYNMRAGALGAGAAPGALPGQPLRPDPQHEQHEQQQQPCHHQHQRRQEQQLCQVEQDLAAAAAAAARSEAPARLGGAADTAGAPPPAAEPAPPPAAKPRLSDGSRAMAELLAAFPDALAGPAGGSHGTIHLMSAVGPHPQLLPAVDGAAAAAGARPPALALPQQRQQPSALPISPNWRPRVSSPGDGAGWDAVSWGPPSGSRDAVLSALGPQPPPATAASAAAAAAGRLQPLLRPGSAQGHRILRPHSCSPIPHGSGSHPLSMEQLGSGELIVDITPPTKVTRDLSWSLDPTAGYVLEASASGGLSPLPAGGAAAASALIARRHSAAGGGGGSYGTSLDELAGGRASGSGGSLLLHSSSVVAFHGGSSAEALGGSAGASPHGSGGQLLLPMAAAGRGAAGGRHQQAASANCSGGSLADGKRHKPGGAFPAAAAVALQPAAGRQQQQQQQQRQQPAALGWGTLPNGAAAAAAQQPARNSLSWGQQQPHRQQGLAAAVPGAAGTGAAPSPSPVAPRPWAGSHYEAVPPSSWRPSDAVESVAGDYLELYRRAYCSYADGLFPPVWLALMGLLASSGLLPLWQLALVGAASFWAGAHVMAVRWAGIRASQLALSRVAPAMVASLELLCTGAFVWHVLPTMWLGHAAKCLAGLVLSAATLSLHLAAHLQDPGFVPLPDTEEGPCARHLASSSPTAANATSPLAAATATGEQQRQGQQGERPPALEGERSPLLPGGVKAALGQHQPAPKLAGRSLDSCWTCGVERDLRSKHCPACRRCVRRLDHHCPVIGNCVGAGNHRTFVCYLACLLLCQLLFCQLLGGMLVQENLLRVVEAPGGAAEGVAAAGGPAAAAARAAPLAAAATALGVRPGAAGSSSSAAELEVLLGGGGSMGLRGWWLRVKALLAASSTSQGLFLLLLVQVPGVAVSASLLLRALALAAANLTLNEWANRRRYIYLQHPAAGFCNRFDRGPAANCAAFWKAPAADEDQWAAWRRGEEELLAAGRTMLSPHSATLLIRLWDRRWAAYSERLSEARMRRRERQLQRRMAALGLQPDAADSEGRGDD